MRKSVAALLAASAFAAPARADDKPVVAPPEAWVVPVALPADAAPPDDKPIRILLSDQQVNLKPGHRTIYSDFAFRIQNSQGLGAGSISLPWQPDIETLTVHKLVIHRGGKLIDVLASGQTFTILRREKELENATLDGELTANLQPEGLQVGDVIEVATSIASTDPTLKGHVEARTSDADSAPVVRQHLRVLWPTALATRLRQSGAQPAFRPVVEGGTTSVDQMRDNVTAPIPPKGAPARFASGRVSEFTDFQSWADMAALFAPLYAKAATLAPDGSLQQELARIRAASSDPRARVQAAVTLVQDQVRYVAMEMGAGGLVPADADRTWARRYGDCKGKTALLLALLHGLGIEAVPVIVNASGGGDGMDQRLPMVSLFDHVLVRATLGGTVLWLDGTRTGDTSLDRLTIPNFGWGLPLLPTGAALVRMMPPPLATPNEEGTLHLDARGGVSAPVPAHAEVVYRRSLAIALRQYLAGLAGDARESALRKFWRERYDFIDIKSVAAGFDPASGEERVTMDGTAHMEWNDGWYETDRTAVGYRADFTRDPGPDSNAPFAVDYPSYLRDVETIALPADFPQRLDPDTTEVNETVAGIEYRRHATVVGTTVTIERSERSIAPEFAAAVAPAAEARLRALVKQNIYLKRPAEGTAMVRSGTTVTKASGGATSLINTGYTLLGAGHLDDAIAAFDRAVAIDPRSALAFADRGDAYAEKHDYASATRDVDAALAIDPRSAVALRVRGYVAFEKHAYPDAVAAFSQSLDINPTNAFTLIYRAQSYLALKNADATLRDADAAIAINPRKFQAYFVRAQAYKLQGKHDLAVGEAAMLMRTWPEAGDAAIASAQIYVALGMNSDAAAALDRAIALKPTADLYVARSILRAPTEQAARTADIDAALALDPANAEARRLRAGLPGTRQPGTATKNGGAGLVALPQLPRRASAAPPTVYFAPPAPPSPPAGSRQSLVNRARNEPDTRH